MKKVDLIVHAPHFFTMEGEGVGYKTDVSMVVNSGKIEGFITAEEEKEIQRTYRVHHSVRNHHSGGYRHVVHPRRRLLEAGVPA